MKRETKSKTNGVEKAKPEVKEVKVELAKDTTPKIEDKITKPISSTTEITSQETKDEDKKKKKTLLIILIIIVILIALFCCIFFPCCAALNNKSFLASVEVNGDGPSDCLTLSTTEVKRDQDFETNIILDTSKSNGFLLSSNLEKVKTGDQELGASQYFYGDFNPERTQAKFKVTKENIKGNFIISVRLFKQSGQVFSASILLNGEGPLDCLSLTNTEPISGQDFETKIKVDSSKSNSYVLTNDLPEINFGSSTLSSDSFNYSVNADYLTGTLNISKEFITGNFTISVKLLNTQSKVYLDFDSTNCSIFYGDSKLESGQLYNKNTPMNLTIKPDDAQHYEVPTNIALKAGGIIKDSSFYTYTVNSQSEASLSFTMSDNIRIDCLSSEKDLILEVNVRPTAEDCNFGFVFQATKHAWDIWDANPVDANIPTLLVDWGDGTESTTFKAPQCVDTDVCGGGTFGTPGGMFAYVGSSLSDPNYKPTIPFEAISTGDEFNRHHFEDYSKTYTIKFYGKINNIAFCYPNPDASDPEFQLFPWGTANKHITSITTYYDFPAENLGTESGQHGSHSRDILPSVDFDSYVNFGSFDLEDVNIALGTSKIPNGLCLTALNLKHVTIPETVNAISDLCFSYTKLDSIKIPDSVKSIGWEAFRADENHENNCLKNGIEFGDHPSLQSIGEQAFEFSSLQEIVFPKTISLIDTSSFKDCKNLRNVIFDSNCSITSINDAAFKNCSSIQNLILPNSLVSIGTAAFQNCDSLIELDLPASVTTIRDSAFNSCDKLTNLNIPLNTSLTILGSKAFACNPMLSTITTLGSNLSTIQNNCFQESSNISILKIPESVGVIESGAFDGWGSGQKLYLLGCADETAAIDKFGIKDPLDITSWFYNCYAQVIYQS